MTTRPNPIHRPGIVSTPYEPYCMIASGDYEVAFESFGVAYTLFSVAPGMYLYAAPTPDDRTVKALIEAPDRGTAILIADNMDIFDILEQCPDAQAA
jgi:hypothetical protein